MIKEIMNDAKKYFINDTDYYVNQETLKIYADVWKNSHKGLFSSKYHQN